MSRPVLPVDRTRLAWWSVVALVTAAVVGFVVAFVGTFVLGLFVYYAARPLERLLERRLPAGVSTGLTVLLLVVPALAVLVYAGTVAFQEFTAVAGPGLTRAVAARLPVDPRTLQLALDDPVAFLSKLENLDQLRSYVLTGLQTLRTVATGLLHLTLALAFAFFLLRDDQRLADWFVERVADEGGVAVAYFSAVDADLQTVYFGNVVTVATVTVAAVALYNGFGLVAPAALRIPFPTLLALLTGLATFVPLVVGKLVYVPVTLYLVWETLRADVRYTWVAGFVLAAFFLLDALPQTVLRPYLSGRTLHTGLVLFAYVLGAALFGWYGLFLGPLVAVLAVQAANVVLPELLHGDRLSPETYTALGHDPRPSRPGAGEESGFQFPDSEEPDAGDAPDS